MLLAPLARRLRRSINGSSRLSKNQRSENNDRDRETIHRLDMIISVSMIKTLTAVEARQNLGEVLEEVYCNGDQFIIERGKRQILFRKRFAIC